MPGLDEALAESLLAQEQTYVWDWEKAYIYGNDEQRKRALDKLRDFISKEFPNDNKKVSILYETNKASWDKKRAMLQQETTKKSPKSI